MNVSLTGASKRFSREWIFREVNLNLVSGKKYAITGHNGSGKSTLLQVIASYLLLSKGEISYTIEGQKINEDEVFKHLTLTAPYLDLPDELTLNEFIHFHFSFKRIKPGLLISDLPELWQLADATNKRIKDFSTGMRQRMKLGISLFSDCPLVLLDEPATNLDENGLDWYLKAVKQMEANQLLLICSNRPEEYSFCDTILDMASFK
ncbi:MAG: ATP-binding cassette domain-containing protein [Cyclobacteriaceae bacterium]